MDNDNDTSITDSIRCRRLVVVDEKGNDRIELYTEDFGEGIEAVLLVNGLHGNQFVGLRSGATVDKPHVIVEDMAGTSWFESFGPRTESQSAAARRVLSAPPVPSGDAGQLLDRALMYTDYALVAAEALDAATSQAVDLAQECIVRAGGDNYTEDEYVRVRRECRVDDLDRVLEVYSAWLGRVFGGHVAREGDERMNAHDLRAEMRAREV